MSPTHSSSAIRAGRAQRVLYWTMCLLLVFSAACNPPAPTSLPTPQDTPVPQPTPRPQEPLAPTLVEMIPPPSSEIGPSQPLTLYFNQAMERASVEGSFQLSPPVSGRFDWLDDSTLRFTPDQQLPAGRDVMVSLSTGARAANGLSLQSAVEIPYHTSGGLVAVSFVPSPDSFEVDPTSAVMVSFNRPVVPLGADPASLPAAFSITPPVNGRGEWLNTSTYIFYPEPALAGGASYAIYLTPTLTTTDGLGWAETFDPSLPWLFYTAAPQVVGFQPVTEQPLGLDEPIVITFNQPMEPASVQAAFSMTSEGGETVSGTFEWSDDYSEMTFTPSGLYQRNTGYYILVETSAASAGGTTLPDAYNVLMYTYGDFGLWYSEPADGGRMEMGHGGSYVKLVFHSPVKRQDYKRLISIDPPIDNWSINTAWDSELALHLYGSFQPRTQYTVRLDPALQDEWGQTLNEPVVISFETSSLQPSFRFAFPMYYGGRAIFLNPAEPVMGVYATNINAAYVTQGRIGLQEMFEYYQLDTDDLNATPPYNVRTWTQALDLPPDENRLVNIPLNQGEALPTGLYYFNIKSDISTEFWNAGPFLGVVSRVNLLVKGVEDQLMVWAVDLETNQPVADAPVTVYNYYGMQVGSGITDAQGMAWITVQTDEIFTGADSQYFVLLGSGVDDPNFSLAVSDWDRGLNSYDFGLPYDYDSGKPVVYVYTDRPIYRPGQTVYFRGVVRARVNGRYYPYDLQEIELKLNGPYSQETGQPTDTQEQKLPISEYGTFNGSFTLPDDATPGTYNFNFITEGLGYPYVYFTVAEYRKPEVELTINFAAGAESLLGGEIQATIESKYYFGAPAANMKISWGLYAAQDYFYLPGYDTGLEDTRWMMPPWYYMDGYGMGNYLAGGEVETDRDGKIQINVPYDQILEQINPEKAQYLTLEATLIEEGEYPVSGRSSQTLHPETYYIGVKPEQWVGQAGRELGFTIQTVDWQQRNAGDKDLLAVFNKVEWVETNFNEGSGMYDYEEVRTEIASANLTTDGLGQARVAFTPPGAGIYEIRVTGGKAVTESMVWVSGPGYAPWPAQANNSLRLTLDADKYDPGQSATIFIPNPFGAGAVGLVTIERGAVMRTELIQFTEAGYNYTLPLTDEDAPNVYFSVVILGRTQAGVPDFRAGYANVKVTPSAFTLNVSLTPSPEQGEPGGTLRFDVLVTDRQGSPVQGEFSLAVVDKAIFALKEPNAEPILSAFYGNQPLAVVTNLSLAAATQRAIAEQLGRGGGGGDGALVPVLREKFEDTAFWSATIVTDAQGRAAVEFPLPDNLTTWVATIRGLTDSTLVGETESEVVVTKDLLVRPVTPRFLVIGDRVQLGANVNNNTGADLSGVQVTLQAGGVQLESPAMQTVDIPANGRANLTWWVNVQDADEVELIFSAKAGDLEDITRPVWGKLPVVRYSSPQTYGTSGMLAEEGMQLEIISLPRSFTPTGGSLTVELSPSLAASILDGLNALDDYPYDITEPIVSRLFANAATYNALSRLNLVNDELRAKLEGQIWEAIEWLENAQNADGGWGWLPNTTSEDHISIYALLALTRAQEIGFGVNADKLDMARSYVAANSLMVKVDSDTDQINREAFRAYVLSEAGYSVDLQSLFNLRDRLAPFARAMLSMSYKKQYPDNTAEYRTLLSDLEGEAVRSATGAHWQSENQGYFNLDSANYNTAAAILALAKFDPANPLMTDAMRYLVASRRATGGWYSSYDSAWVLYSLTEAMAATGELQASYSFSAGLNGEMIAEGQASGPDTLTTVTGQVWWLALYPEDPNALRIERTAGSGRLYYRVYLRVDKPVEEQQPVNKGIVVSRAYYMGGQNCLVEECEPVTSAALSANQNVLVRVTLTVPDDRHYVVVEDYFPAGTEVLDVSLGTTQLGGKDEGYTFTWEDFFSRGYGWWYFSSPKIYDDHVRWVSGYLPAGTYDLTYYLTPIQAGEFRAIPAHAYEYYFPEVEGASAGAIFTITE